MEVKSNKDRSQEADILEMEHRIRGRGRGKGGRKGIKMIVI